MENPKVSIIVPVYNVERYLVQCLESLINQSYTNVEIICINDGSTDNSYSIISKYANRDNRIVLINQENHGLSKSRNKGIQASSGQYLMFVDSDDWINLDTCEIVVKSVVEHNADIIMWPYIREYENKSLKKNIFKEPLIVFDAENTKKNIYKRLIGPTKDEMSKPENLDSLVTACMKLYKTSIIKNKSIEFVDTKKIGTEDALFNIYYFAHVHKSVFLNQFFYHYRRDNSQSLTSIYNKDLFSQWSYLYELINNHIILNNLGTEFSKALDNRIAFNIINLGLNEFNGNGKRKIIERLKEIITSDIFNRPIKNLELKYLPLHWKVFFLAAKLKSATFLFILLKLIKILK